MLLTEARMWITWLTLCLLLNSFMFWLQATDRMICEFALHWIGVGLTRTPTNRLKYFQYKLMGHCVILNDFFNCIDTQGLMKAAEQDIHKQSIIL